MDDTDKFIDWLIWFAAVISVTLALTVVIVQLDKWLLS